MPKKGPRYGTDLSVTKLKLTRGDRAGSRRETRGWAEAGKALVARTLANQAAAPGLRWGPGLTQAVLGSELSA